MSHIAVPQIKGKLTVSEGNVLELGIFEGLTDGVDDGNVLELGILEGFELAEGFERRPGMKKGFKRKC